MPHYNVLFLCTGNSARSITAEAIMNRKGRANFTAFSAGSHPTGAVRPEAIRQLEMAGLNAADLRSKSWNEFSHPDSPHLSFVFTVCDNAAKEVCPIWPGQPMTAHWGIPDPAAVQGTAEEIERVLTPKRSLRWTGASASSYACHLPRSTASRSRNKSTGSERNRPNAKHPEDIRCIK
jgi:arsenate reductase (thioredoxin)